MLCVDCVEIDTPNLAIIHRTLVHFILFLNL